MMEIIPISQVLCCYTAGFLGLNGGVAHGLHDASRHQLT
jgi:hypothetical protein